MLVAMDMILAILGLCDAGGQSIGSAKEHQHDKDNRILNPYHGTLYSHII